MKAEVRPKRTEQRPEKHRNAPKKPETTPNSDRKPPSGFGNEVFRACGVLLVSLADFKALNKPRSGGQRGVPSRLEPFRAAISELRKDRYTLEQIRTYLQVESQVSISLGALQAFVRKLADEGHRAPTQPPSSVSTNEKRALPMPSRAVEQPRIEAVEAPRTGSWGQAEREAFTEQFFQPTSGTDEVMKLVARMNKKGSKP